MFMMSSSRFWNASQRAWSSSMMLISTRPTWGIFLPFICAIIFWSAGSFDVKSQVNPRYSGFASSTIFEPRTHCASR